MTATRPFGGRPPPATLGTILCASGLFVAWAFADGPAWVAGRLAISGAALRRGDLWTVATALLVHVDPRDLIANCVALWAFGSPLERLWGRRRWLRTVVAAGLVANVVAGLAAVAGLPGVACGLGPSVLALCLAWAQAIGDARVRVIGGAVHARMLAYFVIGIVLLGSVMAARWLETLHLLAGLAAGWLGGRGGGPLDLLRRRFRRRHLRAVPPPPDDRLRWN